MVRKGAFELEEGQDPFPDGRVRREGGGRKSAGVLDPGLVPALLALVEPDERGDPESPLRCTTASHGNPAGVAAISDQTCARTAARTRATLSRVRGSASSSVRRTVVSLGSGPSTGAWWASTVMSLMLVAPSTIATAMETSAMPRSTSGNFPARASADPSAAVSPAWSASLRSSTVPAYPTRPSPSPVTFSAWSQPVSCMTKSAPA